MEGEDSKDSDEIPTFTLELKPYQMYSLSALLHYNRLNMEDPMFQTLSEAIAKKVNESMASEAFNEGMEMQFEEASEIQQAMGPDNSLGRGVQ